MLLHRCVVTWVSFALLPAGLARAEPAPPQIPVGVAKIDITPELPIQLVGYSRQGEASEVGRPLHARAIAIGGDGDGPVVLIAAEVCGITAEISDAVASALAASHRLDRARVAVCVTHTHAGPAIRGLLPYSFGRDMTPEQAARVGRYTDALREKLIAVGRAALRDRKPARLAWGEGRATFAVHRRVIRDGKWSGFGQVRDGPVDHALPVLRVTGGDGAVRAIFTSYACHCTAIGGVKFIHSDWAGEASAALEASHPGAIAPVAIGCGGDAGPDPKGSPEAAVEIGRQVQAAVQRVLGGELKPLDCVPTASWRRIHLSLDREVTRAELAERAQSNNRLDAFAARKLLEELEAGRPPRTSVPYLVQAWTFGDRLAMVFLAGEVVSAYSLRLRRELDASRLWVNAYANSVPCYIPSRQMYSEGGYEVDNSIVKYGWPVRLGPDTEDRIVAAVHALLPPEFRR